MSIENQFNRICRTCLTQEYSNDTSSSLYTVIDLENGESLQISKIIENCINLEMTTCDRLPQIICNNCTIKIRNFYVFRDKCHKNDTFLRNQLDTWKIKYEVKIEDAVENLLEVQIKSVEEVKILEFPEIDGNEQEDFGETDNDYKSEINIFEDCPGDTICAENFSVNSKNAEKAHCTISNVDSSIFKKSPNTRAKNKKCKTDDGNNEKVPQTMFNKHERTVNILMPSKRSSTAKVKTKKCTTNGGNDQEFHKVFHKCDICFEIFDNRKELMSHRRANHINEISEEFYTIVRKDNKTHYICKICKRFCKHKNILRVHLRSHTGEKPYKCAVCSQSFAQKWHSRKHMELHNLETIEKKPAIFYKCALCKEDFESEVAVKRHYDEHHPPSQEKEQIRLLTKSTEWQLCNICGKFLKDLTEHLKWHAGKKKYECKICGKILSTPSSLSQHRQRHAVDKKYVCDTCGKSFKIQHDLTFHRKVHFEERKHECHICDRKFLHKVRLRIHLKVHAGEKPYQKYDNRKREKKRQQRMEMIKNGIPLPTPLTRKEKEILGSTLKENPNPTNENPVQSPVYFPPMFPTAPNPNQTEK